MSDEQTEILRQMLEMQKESLAFAKSQRAEFLALQNKGLTRQRNGLLLAMLVILVGILIMATSIVGGQTPNFIFPTH